MMGCGGSWDHSECCGSGETEQCCTHSSLRQRLYSLRQYGGNQYDILAHRNHLEHLLVSGGGPHKYQVLADRKVVEREVVLDVQFSRPGSMVSTGPLRMKLIQQGS